MWAYAPISLETIIVKTEIKKNQKQLDVYKNFFKLTINCYAGGN